jgi:hypothetical protein
MPKISQLLRFSYLKLPKTQPAFVERNMNWQPRIEPITPETGQTGGSGGAAQKLTPHEQKQGQEQAKRAPKRGMSLFFE